jgi:hypothetical protein
VNVLNSPLFVEGSAGDDRILAVQDPSLVTRSVAFSGGAGNDTVQGGPFADILSGGPGDDAIFGGPGDDIISWQNGDGQDSIDGGTGRDRVVASGSRGLADAFVVTPDGALGVVAIGGASSGGLRIGAVETFDIFTLGGADVVIIAPLVDTAVNVVGADAGSPREGAISVLASPADGPGFQYLGPGAGAWSFLNRSSVTFLNYGAFNAPSNVLYVLALYRTVLGREGNAAEPDVWIAALGQGAAPFDVSRGFWESPEHRGLQVDGYYASFLGRPATPSERASAVDAFLRGADETAVVQQIVTSPPYRAANPRPALFARSLILDVLGRRPRRRELATFLRGRASARAISRSILASRENSRRTVDALSLSILGQPAVPEVREALAVMLTRRQITATTIAERFLSSQEFLARVSASSPGPQP